MTETPRPGSIWRDALLLQARKIGVFGRLPLLVVASCASVSAPTADELKDYSDRLSKFAPRPKPNSESTVDYKALDAALSRIVFRAGPSLRRVAPRPRPFTGSRIVYAHTSPLRLEGNKVIFSRLSADAKDIIHQLRSNLVGIGNHVNIPTLPRNEQLAYWFNLHNIIVLSELAKQYPVLRPRRLEIEPDDRPLHEAPVVEIAGVPLSLTDIRIGIVYRYWDDPRVFYGFFHGDLASPSIRDEAWTGDSVWAKLRLNVIEFVNSLRGARQSGNTLLVSPLYEEARGTLFVNWPTDLRTHLREFADSETQTVLAQTTDVGYSRYEGRIADIIGGRPHTPFSQIVPGKYGPTVTDRYERTTDQFAPFGKLLPISNPNYTYALEEYQKKFHQLRQLGKLPANGEIRIIDLPRDDADENADKESADSQDVE